MINELHFAFHKLDKISNRGQGQSHNYGTILPNEQSVVCFAQVAVDSSLAVVVDSNLVAVAVAVEVAVVIVLVVALEQVG